MILPGSNHQQRSASSYRAAGCFPVLEPMDTCITLSGCGLLPVLELGNLPSYCMQRVRDPRIVLGRHWVDMRKWVEVFLHVFTMSLCFYKMLLSKSLMTL